MNQRRILWADDSNKQFDDCLEILRPYLRERGIEVNVTRAQTGDAVFRLLLRESALPDVLIVDLEMPGWNGIDTVKDLAHKYPELPKIVVSQRTADPQFASDLLQFERKGVIAGYFPVSASDEWCSAIFSILTYRNPVILHMSDLHFGGSHAFQGKLELEDLMGLFLSSLGPQERPTLLILSGDLVDRGKRPEFDRGLRFLEKLQTLTHLDAGRIIIVPGNHDVYRGEEEQARLGHFLDFLNQFYSSSPMGHSLLRNYRCYDMSTTSLKTLPPQGIDGVFAIHSFDEFQLTVLAMNSVTVEDSRLELGEISERQLLMVREGLATLRSPRLEYPRIAVFHHHLFPVPSFLNDGEPERVLRRQALALRYLIGQRIHLVLHGHTHYTAAYKFAPYLIDGRAALATPIHIFGTGTLSSRELVPSQSWFHLALISLPRDPSGALLPAIVQPYRLSEDSLEWIATPKLTFDLEVPA
jgi:CheY-like chemotaxis protein